LGCLLFRIGSMDDFGEQKVTRDETPREPLPAAQRAKWERPAIRRLAAGDAEVEAVINADGGVTD